MPFINGINVGTNNGQNQIARQQGIDFGGSNDLIQQLQFLGADMYPTAVQQAAFGNNLEGGREQTLRDQIAALSPGNQWNNAQAARAQAQGGANDVGQQLAAQLRSAPAGIGSQQGAMVMANNNANRSVNDYLTNINSPQGISQTASALSNLYGQGQQQTYLQNLLGMAGPMANQASLNQQTQASNFASSPFGMLGGMVGQLGPSMLGGGMMRGGNGGSGGYGGSAGANGYGGANYGSGYGYGSGGGFGTSGLGSGSMGGYGGLVSGNAGGVSPSFQQNAVSAQPAAQPSTGHSFYGGTHIHLPAMTKMASIPTSPAVGAMQNAQAPANPLATRMSALGTGNGLNLGGSY